MNDRNKHLPILFFLLALLLALAPVWLVGNFHTGDGPAHLYNAHVLSDLLFDSSSVFNQYFYLHVMPVPNAIIQLVLAILLLFVSSVVANKIIISFIILLIALGYRYLLNSLSDVKANAFTLLLIVFCFPMKMGLYSFMAGIGVMMFGLGYYIRSHKKLSRTNLIILTGLVTLTWFFHFFTCMALLLLILIYEVIYIFQVKKSATWNANVKRRIPLLLIVAPIILLLLLFSSSAINATPTVYASTDELISWLKELTVLEYFHTEREEWIAWFLIMVFVISLVIQVVRIKNNFTSTSIFLWISLILFLILYFTMPLNFFSGGLINLRLSYLLILIACVFIDLSFRVAWVNYFKNGSVILLIGLMSVNLYKNMKPFSERSLVILDAANKIEEGSLVLPLSYATENFEYNFNLYLSCDRNIVVLDNAEAATPNGLVRWKENIWKPELIGNYLQSTSPTISINDYEHSTGEKIDYVFSWNISELPQDSVAATLLSNDFRKLQSGSEASYSLYHRK